MALRTSTDDMRIQFIIGQALFLVIQKLEEVPMERREISNIADMQYLLENHFQLFMTVESARARNRTADQTQQQETSND